MRKQCLIKDFKDVNEQVLLLSGQKLFLEKKTANIMAYIGRNLSGIVEEYHDLQRSESY